VYDARVSHTTETIPLSDFVGKTLGEVQRFYAGRNDAVFQMQRDILIRNDKHIDLSPKYPNTEKDYEKGSAKNSHGWLSERDGVTDEYVIDVGDEAFFNCWKYFHVACHDAHISAKAEAQFREILRCAGYPKDTMLMPTENLYGSAEYRGPWFLAYYQDGCIRIGWRKRVIEIDWSRVRNASLRTAIAEQFANVDSTHTDTVVHAYDPETASKFLSDIRRMLKGASVEEVLED
jgi:hypothetical protein